MIRVFHSLLSPGLLLLCLAGPAAAGQADPLAALAAEYPRYDQQVWELVHKGLVAKNAAERLALDPENPETVAWLLRAWRIEDALRVIANIVQKHPRHIARTFEIVSEQSHRFRSNSAREHWSTVQDLIVAARARLGELTREEAARTSYYLSFVDTSSATPRGVDWQTRVIDQYPETEEARLLEIDLVTGVRRRGFAEELDAFDAIAAKYPGTVVAAKARYQKAFQLAHNFPVWKDSTGRDPTARFFQVVEIATELESGRYPRCKWVDRAPSLVSRFHAYQPIYAPGNADLVLKGLIRFIRMHPNLETIDPSDPFDEIEHVVTSQMPAVVKAKGQWPQGMEPVFAELEREPAIRSAIRYLRARFYVNVANWDRSVDRTTFVRKAITSLSALHAEGTGFYRRKALATLASIQFHEHDYVNARDSYRQYLRHYPRSPWAWVAGIRIGQSDEALGEPKRAAASYRAAATRYPAMPLARVLGYEHAARTSEALGQFDQALRDHRAALDGWDPAYGLTYSVDDGWLTPPGLSVSSSVVDRQRLSRRIAQLERSLSFPGGTVMERGRWLIDDRRYKEAVGVLEPLLMRDPRSPIAAESRELAHSARLGAALSLAAIDSPAFDETTAMAELDALAKESFDFAVAAARIAKACILWKRGASTAAEALLDEALREWQAYQLPLLATAATPLEQDIAAIRNVVFGPGGNPIIPWLWTAFRWPTLSRFFVLNPEVNVNVPGAELMRMAVHQPLADLPNVLFLNDEQLAFFDSLFKQLGATTRPRRGSTTATSSQPADRSRDLLALFNRFFPARPSSWAMRAIETYPIITRIEFTNAERTKAAAHVTIGNSGATVVLEKIDGTWTPKAVVDNWIA